MPTLIAKFRNNYDCPCGASWTDDWDSMCDDRCPVCNTSCSPTRSEELIGESLTLTFAKNFDKIEAMMAKIYKTYGSSEKSTEGTMTGRMTSRVPNFWDIELNKVIAGTLGARANMIITDDMVLFPERFTHEGGREMDFDPMDFLNNPEELRMIDWMQFPEEKDWKRTKFVSGGETLPDADTRAKLRAKRKGKKK